MITGLGPKGPGFNSRSSPFGNTSLGAKNGFVSIADAAVAWLEAGKPKI